MLEERLRFIAALVDEDDSRTMTELCRQFGISRNTGYKYKGRFELTGVDGLKDRSRAPLRHSNETPARIRDLLVEARQLHPTWGPKKLLGWLTRKYPEEEHWPAVSTAGEILKRHGLITPRKKRRRTPPQTEPFIAVKRPNDVWCADFKGWFRTGDGSRCEPLTITDACSRYVLVCTRVPTTRQVHVRPHFERAFRKYGMPSAIRTDNGPPFASRAVGGLTRLSTWWITLGIRPERIEPGEPQQNGRHERMHLTLKQETASPPRRSLRAQQRAFNRFVQEFNYERPHEALGNHAPADVYEPSHRQYPRKPPDVVYPPYFATRSVRRDGYFKWGGRYTHLTEALAGHRVGFEPSTDDCWRVYFGPHYLGMFDEVAGKVISPPSPRRPRPR